MPNACGSSPVYGEGKNAGKYLICKRNDEFSCVYSQCSSINVREELKRKANHWHLLMHNMGGSAVARHAFSRNGVSNWTSSAIPPYSRLVTFSDGSTKKMTRRERPQLVLSNRGQPRYFSSGVQDVADHTYTLVIAVNSE